MALIEEGETYICGVITANRTALEKPANLLQEKEVINKEEMMALFENN